MNSKVTWKRVANGVYQSNLDYSVMRWAGKWELYCGTTYLGSARTLPLAKELCTTLHRTRRGE
jgi:hypothetical protein